MQAAPVVPSLLIDRTMTATSGSRRGLVFGTGRYAGFDSGYATADALTQAKVTGEASAVLALRPDPIPAWAVNAAMNRLDRAFFGRDAFDAESADHRDWTPTGRVIRHRGEGFDWKDYVTRKVLDASCGAAEMLATAWDTGASVPVGRRVGALDRKLRLVCERSHSRREWEAWVRRAYRSTYAYDADGILVLTARTNLVADYVDHYRLKWESDPPAKSLSSIAAIVSWNVWQMDGATCRVPCPSGARQGSLFGVATGDGADAAGGVECLVMDWEADPEHGVARVFGTGEASDAVPRSAGADGRMSFDAMLRCHGDDGCRADASDMVDVAMSGRGASIRVTRRVSESWSL